MAASPGARWLLAPAAELQACQARAAPGALAWSGLRPYAFVLVRSVAAGEAFACCQIAPQPDLRDGPRAPLEAAGAEPAPPHTPLLLLPRALCALIGPLASITAIELGIETTRPPGASGTPVPRQDFGESPATPGLAWPAGFARAAHLRVSLSSDGSEAVPAIESACVLRAIARQMCGALVAQGGLVCFHWLGAQLICTLTEGCKPSAPPVGGE
ncbi:hypothetical protein T492DRAFT_888610 [Pavlovales sp. CCMP2436]|nr:hypothetical protein T492DRAFT_888610 [Pavlovales sp. CCMP2436]